MTIRTQRARWRKDAASKVARRRAAGLCIVCGHSAPKKRATCPDCGRAANLRTKRRKATA